MLAFKLLVPLGYRWQNLGANVPDLEGEYLEIPWKRNKQHRRDLNKPVLSTVGICVFNLVGKRLLKVYRKNWNEEWREGEGVGSHIVAQFSYFHTHPHGFVHCLIL